MEAFEQLERTEAEARQLVAAGERRYERAAAAAAAEREQVRAKLAIVSVRVSGAPPGAEVEVDGKRTPLAEDGTTSFVHVPGGVTLVLHLPDQPVVTRTLQLSAGRDLELVIDLQTEEPEPEPEPPPPKPDDDELSPWVVPAVIAAGVALLGAGAFIGFGVRSTSIRSDLDDRCAPSCGTPADEDARTKGERYAKIANAGMVVGIVGLAAAIPFIVLAASDEPADEPAPAISVVVAPTGLGLLGSF